MRNKLNYNLNWSEHFQIDNDSPSGVVRIKDRYNNDIEGYAVGHKQYRKNGKPMAWVLKFQGRPYLVHRVIWVLTYGSIDHTLVIDHLDGDPFNNKIENLSLKIPADNKRNSHKYRSNTTGITGVGRNSNGVGHYYYTAYWRELSGLLKFKHFSIAKLGEENAKELAVAYRKEQIQRLITEGADYTERHGTELLILNKQENK